MLCRINLMTFAFGMFIVSRKKKMLKVVRVNTLIAFHLSNAIESMCAIFYFRLVVCLISSKRLLSFLLHVRRCLCFFALSFTPRKIAVVVVVVVTDAFFPHFATLFPSPSFFLFDIYFLSFLF